MFHLLFTVQFTSSTLIYPQSSYSLSTTVYFSTAPIISGDLLQFNITSGTLPDGLVLDPTTGKISGIPSTPSHFIDVIVQASNQVGSIQTQLFFMVNSISTLTIILISLIVLLIVINLILIVILSKKKKKPTLPIKSLHEVKSLKNHVVNPSTPQSNSSPPQSNIAVFDPVPSNISSLSSKQHSFESSSVSV